MRRVERWLEIRRLGAIAAAVIFTIGALIVGAATALGVTHLPAAAGLFEGLRPMLLGVGFLIAGPALVGFGALGFRANLSRVLSGPRARAFRLFPPENPGGSSGAGISLTV